MSQEEEEHDIIIRLKPAEVDYIVNASKTLLKLFKRARETSLLQVHPDDPAPLKHMKMSTQRARDENRKRERKKRAHTVKPTRLWFQQEYDMQLVHTKKNRWELVTLGEWFIVPLTVEEKERLMELAPGTNVSPLTWLSTHFVVVSAQHADLLKREKDSADFVQQLARITMDLAPAPPPAAPEELAPVPPYNENSLPTPLDHVENQELFE